MYVPVAIGTIEQRSKEYKVMSHFIVSHYLGTVPKSADAKIFLILTKFDYAVSSTKTRF